MSAARRGARALLAALLAAGLPAACGPAPAPRHVVVVVLDALHAAHASCYGGPPGLTPALDALAAAGTRFDRAFTAAPWTLPSTASLMTGLSPERHGVLTPARGLPEAATTLAERFRAAGWRTGAFVQMVYASDAYGLDQGFDDYRYYAKTGEKLGPLVVYDAGRWMEQHADERTLLYVHLRRPHSPYDPPMDAWERSGARPAQVPPDRLDLLVHADARVRGLDDLRAGELEVVRDLYRANLLAADGSLEALWQRMPDPERTLVVVLSDHGEALGEHGAFGHGLPLWAEVLDIPFLVRGPGVVAQVSDAPACTLDVMPTLLDACGLPPEPGTEGVSLWPHLRGGPAPRRPAPVAVLARQDAGEPDAVAVVDGGWKLLRTADGELTLYDRVADRTEVAPAEDAPADLASRLAAFALERLAVRREAMQRALPEPTLDDDNLEQLRELGYVR